MLSDRFERYIDYFDCQLKQHLGDSIKPVEVKKELDFHGYFFLKYYYVPLRLFVLIDSEYGLFSVRIEQEDGSYNTLNQIEPFDNYISMNETESMNNINRAVILLKKALENPITFYKAMNGGLYRKERNDYVRLSWDEIKKLRRKQ